MPDSTDNGAAPDALLLPCGVILTPTFEPDVLGGVTLLRGPARRVGAWNGDLYRGGPPTEETTTLTAMPCLGWDNSEAGEMAVWIRSA